MRVKIEANNSSLTFGSSIMSAVSNKITDTIDFLNLITLLIDKT